MTDSERLIREVEKRPCLWQTGSEDYSKREMKDRAWEDVCRELYPQCLDYFEIQKQVADLKKKWVNIRAYYRKETLTRKEDKTGTTANMKRKKYVFADILRFLDPVLDNKESEENIDNSLEENDSSSFIKVEENTSNSNPNIPSSNLQKERPPRKYNTQTTRILKPKAISAVKLRKQLEKNTQNSFGFNFTSGFLDNIHNQPSPSATTPTIKTENNDESPEIIPLRKNKKLKKDESVKNNVDLEILNILKNMQQHSPGQTVKDTDPDTSFLLSLVPDVKSLTDMQKLQFKTGIFLLLNQLKFSNSNSINIHAAPPSPIPFTKSQFNFPFYIPWSHYMQDIHKDTNSINNIAPSSLSVSPPLPSSSNNVPVINNNTAASTLFSRETSSTFPPTTCTPIPKSYH